MVVVVALASMVLGTLLEPMFFAGWDNEQDAERNTGSERRNKNSEGKSAEVLQYSSATPVSLTSSIKEIVDVNLIASTAVGDMKAKGIFLPARASDLAVKFVEAALEGILTRLQTSSQALLQVSTGEMSVADLQQQHPKTAAVLTGLKQSCEARGLTTNSSVMDVVNSITGSGGSEQQRQSTCGGSGVATATFGGGAGTSGSAIVSGAIPEVAGASNEEGPTAQEGAPSTRVRVDSQSLGGGGMYCSHSVGCF